MRTFKFFQDEIHIWVTYNGTSVPVNEISDKHMNNIIKCLMGHGEVEIPNPYLGKTHEEWFNIFREEIQRRLSLYQSIRLND